MRRFLRGTRSGWSRVCDGWSWLVKGGGKGNWMRIIILEQLKIGKIAWKGHMALDRVPLWGYLASE